MPKFQRWRRTKIDPLDTLYSKIIRFGIFRCPMCNLWRDVQCCHIMGRGHSATRYMLTPVRNAVPLCANCHDWFDSHKIPAVILNEKKRVFKRDEESFTWLNTIGYTWKDLEWLLQKAKRTTKKLLPFEQKIVKEQLTEELKRLESESRVM